TDAPAGPVPAARAETGMLPARLHGPVPAGPARDTSADPAAGQVPDRVACMFAPAVASTGALTGVPVRPRTEATGRDRGSAAAAAGSANSTSIPAPSSISRLTLTRYTDRRLIIGVSPCVVS